MPPSMFRPRTPRIPVAKGSKVAPFVGGMVTDVGLAELPVNVSHNLQDVIFPRGIAAMRGAPQSAGVGANPFSGADILGLVALYDIPPTVGSSYWVGSSDGRIANAGLAGTISPGGASAYIPFCVFQGEILWFCQDGVRPIVRTVNGTLGTTPSSAGTLTSTLGSTSLVGVGTSWTGYNGYSVYLDIGDMPPYALRVVIASDNTDLSVATPVPVARSGVSFAARQWGLIGVCTTVTDAGSATLSGTTMTGEGTEWGHSGAGYGAVAVGDLVSWKGTAGAAMYSGISAVTNDTTLTVSGGAAQATPIPYRVHRPLVGTHGCVHNGRLWVCGCQWQPRRVYWTPEVSSTQVAGQGLIPWTLGDPTNGNFSFATQPGDACVADYVDVPDANTPGSVVGVASTPSGVLVLATDGCYIITGDPPSIMVKPLAASADCVDARSIVTTHGGVFWAGRTGIYMFSGGRVTDLTAGKRNAEWRSLISGYVNGSAVVSWFARGHLSVCFMHTAVTGTPYTWVYDATRQVWCGNHTTSAISSWTMPDSDEAYVVPAGLTQASETAYFMSGVYTDPPPVSDPAAVFIADLPPSAAGDSITHKRVTEVLVRWSGSSGGSLSVQSAMDASESAGSVTFGTDGTLTAPGPDINTAATVRVRPVTDVTALAGGALGVGGRAFQMRFTATGSACPQLRVYEVDLFTRNFAPTT